ncbi:CheR family methyltransferase [Seleniivibrio woodruffii]|uniref:protein-glutamate O-methyltransferase n=1 Tax=Seleniivibrio woodruffii TaxID=1078050 RepID=A0A4R1KBL3_9BACT|nr:protein-glutamate O-methyltransferase CheR [Seleniivibrio woodruffii]TCK61865.1 chemotaxis protein methyltransferase CheR [Seleniivibrio woodruffii]TVZ35020.1 MCP methyltransferase, CheR-type [Seleniivibrio woodruffii]
MFINNDDYIDLTAFIYKKSGIKFEDKKRYFINKRVEKRLIEMNIDNVRDYLRFLKFKDNGDEFQSLMNLLTVNETYFFREFSTLETFAEHCLQEIAERKAASGDKSIRIWSAGCSTGEEPYTLAIIVREMLDNLSGWDVRILASDIDENVLAKAQNARYDDRSLKDMPDEYYSKYFIRSDGYHTPVKEVRNMVSFEHLNLMDKEAMRRKRGFDFIFCRNVLIYFDDLSRKQVVDHYYIAMNKGGYIFLGHSESVGRITTAFSMKRMGSSVVYYKG